MSRGGWGNLLLFLWLSIAFLIMLNVLANYFTSSESKVKPEETSQIKSEVEKIEEVFRTCYIPVADAPFFIEDLRDYCDNPFLNKTDFFVERGPFSIDSVEFKGKELELVEIEPTAIRRSEKGAVCLAFRKIAREIRERGGYAVAICDDFPTLKVGIPNTPNDGKKGGFIKLVKILPEKP